MMIMMILHSKVNIMGQRITWIFSCTVFEMLLYTWDIPWQLTTTHQSELTNNSIESTRHKAHPKFSCHPHGDRGTSKSSSRKKTRYPICKSTWLAQQTCPTCLTSDLYRWTHQLLAQRTTHKNSQWRAPYSRPSKLISMGVHVIQMRYHTRSLYMCSRPSSL